MEWYLVGRTSSLSRRWGSYPSPRTSEKNNGKACTPLNPWVAPLLERQNPLEHGCHPLEHGCQRGWPHGWDGCHVPHCCIVKADPGCGWVPMLVARVAGGLDDGDHPRPHPLVAGRRAHQLEHSFPGRQRQPAAWVPWVPLVALLHCAHPHGCHACMGATLRINSLLLSEVCWMDATWAPIATPPRFDPMDLSVIAD